MKKLILRMLIWASNNLFLYTLWTSWRPHLIFTLGRIEVYALLPTVSEDPRCRQAGIVIVIINPILKTLSPPMKPLAMYTNVTNPSKKLSPAQHDLWGRIKEVISGNCLEQGSDKQDLACLVYSTIFSIGLIFLNNGLWFYTMLALVHCITSWVKTNPDTGWPRKKFL